MSFIPVFLPHCQWMASALEGSGRSSLALSCLRYAASGADASIAPSPLLLARHAAALYNSSDAATALTELQSAISVFTTEPTLRYLFGLVKMKTYVREGSGRKSGCGLAGIQEPVCSVVFPQRGPQKWQEAHFAAG